MKKIVLFTSVFYNNIGNGFIDLGAEATLQAAAQDICLISKLSQCANFAATMDWKFRLKESTLVDFVWKRVMGRYRKILHDKAYGLVSTHNVLSVALLTKCDYFVVPGCVLTVPFFRIYRDLLIEKKNQGVKIIFLGASGNNYTQEEISIVKNYLDELRPFAIMTRDSIAYENYANYAENSFNGIDNVFFVNRLALPETETTIDPYYCVNIESPNHLQLKKALLDGALKDKNIIFTDHKPYPYSKITKMVKSNVIISDYPLDYLTLYKGVSATYSDRVHACIPTVAFGHKARLFSDTPRKALFENVGLYNITTTLTGFQDIQTLITLQEKQIRYLRKILT